MEKTIAFVACGLMTFSVGATAQIKMNDTGKVRINNSCPTSWLDVLGILRFLQNGFEVIFAPSNLYPNIGFFSLGNYYKFWNEIYADHAYFTPTIMSDTNFQSITKNLPTVHSKFNSLHPVTCIFDLNKFQTTSNGPNPSNNTNHFGFLFQVIQTIFPELGSTRQDLTLDVRYTELIPIFVKSYQDQQSSPGSLSYSLIPKKINNQYCSKYKRTNL